MTDRSALAERIIGSRQTLIGAENSLENVNTTLLDDGALCYVASEHLHYELHRDDTDAPNPPFIIAPAAGGPGRWVPATGGTQGPQGPQGRQGSQGAQGTQGGGFQGATGATGVQGFQGAQGTQGAGFQGAQGATGVQGFQGAQGTQGAGFQGAQGGTGAQGAGGGAQGAQGAIGVQGFQGAQGAGFQGAQGRQGGIGAQGAQGSQGATGTGQQGAQGAGGVGTQGAQGATGSIGQQGFQGSIGTAGTTGAQGSQGFQGAQGRQGNTGVQGAQGTQGGGFQGATGSQGFQGAQGTQGAGFQGAQGASGPQGTGGGAQGAQGATGVQGFQGAQGFQGGGFQGAQGAQAGAGAQGAQGAAGTAGTAGAQGGQGFQGAQGRQGNTGAAGTTGTTGAQGAQGFTGATGTAGTTGAQGAAGPQGFQGIAGAGGAQGSQGRQGATGTTGTTGVQGSQGATGLTGPQGFQGAQGRQGVTGTQGSQGFQGAAINPLTQVFYVDAANTGTATGSIAQPYASPTAAFAAQPTGNITLLIAPGVYTTGLAIGGNRNITMVGLCEPTDQTVQLGFVNLTFTTTAGRTLTMQNILCSSVNDLSAVQANIALIDTQATGTITGSGVTTNNTILYMSSVIEGVRATGMRVEAILTCAQIFGSYVFVNDVLSSSHAGSTTPHTFKGCVFQAAPVCGPMLATGCAFNQGITAPNTASISRLTDCSIDGTLTVAAAQGDTLYLTSCRVGSASATASLTLGAYNLIVRDTVFGPKSTGSIALAFALTNIQLDASSERSLFSANNGRATIGSSSNTIVALDEGEANAYPMDNLAIAYSFNTAARLVMGLQQMTLDRTVSLSTTGAQALEIQPMDVYGTNGHTLTVQFNSVTIKTILSTDPPSRYLFQSSEDNAIVVFVGRESFQ